MEYQVFTNEAAASSKLEIAPSSIWVISTLEVVLDQEGHKSMLLTYPSYALLGQQISDVHDEGYWAPPFMAYPVPMGFSPPATLGSVRELVQAELQRIDITKDLSQLAYQMGLRDVHLEPREPFLELKVSPRSPGLVKAYWILRHGLVRVDDACLPNLADAEVRRGYVFCPTVLKSPTISKKYSHTHNRDELWFLGKPLQSNVEHVLGNLDRRSALESGSLTMERSLFTRQESGVVCVVDLAGYGRALQYAGTAMHSFTQRGEDAQHEMRRTVSERLQLMLANMGATQAQIAGDGFVAAFPDRVFSDQRETIRMILTEWAAVIRSAESLNGSIRDPQSRVGSRIALHHGPYSYGRTGGTGSFLAAFDGQTMVEAVRMEQALAMLPRSALAHRLVIAPDLQPTAQPVLTEFGWSGGEQRALTAKEFEGQAWVYSRSEGSIDGQS